MSKNGELKILEYGRSIDAPINYHHRTGDSDGSCGNMLDLYTHAESAEEIYFGKADELAREMFLKGFRVYLKKVFTEQEREFLKRLLAGNESPYQIGRSLGVEHFAFLQGIQLKAYKNAKPLVKLAKITGWSCAELFTETIYERLAQLNAGYALNKIIPQNAKVEKFREKKNAIMRRWRANNCERHREYMRVYMTKWCAEHREELRARYRQYYADNREREAERKKKQRQNPEYLARDRARALAYRTKHAEERRAKNREYYAKNREEINAKHRAYYAANKERIIAGRNAPEKREKRREYMKEYGKAHRAEEREYRRARYTQVRERKLETARKWREANPERARELQRAAQQRYLAKKKAEREAAKAVSAT